MTTDKTEVSIGYGQAHARFAGFDVTHILLTLLICLCFAAVFWQVLQHDKGDAQRATEQAQRDERVMTLLTQLVKNDQLIVENQNRILTEIAFGNKAVQQAVIESSHTTNFVLTRTDQERRALNLQMPAALKAQMRKPRRDDE